MDKLYEFFISEFFSKVFCSAMDLKAKLLYNNNITFTRYELQKTLGDDKELLSNQKESV